MSDLLLLGRATIEESLLLLHWLGQAGHERLGECCAGVEWRGVYGGRLPRWVMPLLHWLLQAMAGMNA